ncbi:MAG TPA: hypothetical protein VIJ34_16560 [Acidimicrobiales bacterium]
MTMLAKVTTGEIGFGIFVLAAVVLVVFVIRFALSLGRRKR